MRQSEKRVFTCKSLSIPINYCSLFISTLSLIRREISCKSEYIIMTMIKRNKSRWHRLFIYLFIYLNRSIRFRIYNFLRIIKYRVRYKGHWIMGLTSSSRKEYKFASRSDRVTQRSLRLDDDELPGHHFASQARS